MTFTYGAIEATTAMLSNNLSPAKNEKCIFLLSVLSLNSHFHRDRIRQVRTFSSDAERRVVLFLNSNNAVGLEICCAEFDTALGRAQ